MAASVKLALFCIYRRVRGERREDHNRIFLRVPSGLGGKKVNWVCFFKVTLKLPREVRDTNSDTVFEDLYEFLKLFVSFCAFLDTFEHF